MFTRISYLAEGAFGFFLPLAIALFGVNHRWSIAATLLAMLFGLIAVLLKQNQIEIEQKKWLKISFAGILIFSVAVWLGLWFHDSNIRLYDNYSRLFLLSPLVFLLVKLNLPRRNLYLGFLIGVVAIFYSALTYSDNWGGRAIFTYSNALSMSNVAGEFLAITAAVFLCTKKGGLVANVSIVLIVCLFVVVIMTGTKGVWLTVLTIGLLTLFHLKTFKERFLLIGFFVSLFAVVNYSTNNMPVKRINVAMDSVSCLMFSESKLKCNGSSVVARASMWLFVYKKFKEAPFLGHGMQNFQTGLTQAAEALEISQKYTTYNNPHNDFVKLLHDFGIIGLFALIFLFSSLLAIAKRVISIESSVGGFWGYALLLHTVFSVELGLTQSNFAVASQSFQFAFFTLLLLGLAIRSLSNKAP